MDAKIITIGGDGSVSVPEEVQMRPFEIAGLFEVYEQTVNSHIKAVLKSGVVKTDASCTVVVCGNTIAPCVYGLDMVAAIAFRVDSPKTEVFRRWVVRKMTGSAKPPVERLIVRFSRRSTLN